MEKDITPDKKISLAGQFYERVSEYVETPLTVTAMAIGSGKEYVIFCSCDLVAVSTVLMSDVRARIASECSEINTDAVIISATHTHTSYEYRKRGSEAVTDSLKKLREYMPAGVEYIDRVPLPEDVMSPEDAADVIAEKISEACIEAYKNMKPASFTNQFGRVGGEMLVRNTVDEINKMFK
ncbi:MAG: hypothetical protein IJF32_06155 [Oscillospiraceae bacterium]|nr:hypothetical protein [Oscillospiraceae bacterium]